MDSAVESQAERTLPPQLALATVLHHSHRGSNEDSYPQPESTAQTQESGTRSV